jgi:chorismate synthase
VLIDGCPAGLALAPDDLARDLARRRGGKAGTTTRVEADVPRLWSGVHDGSTTGAPILILFENRDADPSAYDAIRERPRPGHADLIARQKFGGYADHRGGGHFSGRLTVGLVAAGAIARKLLDECAIAARVTAAGGRGDPVAEATRAAAEQDSVGGLVECRASGLPAGLGEPFFDSLESALAHAALAIPGVKGIEFGAGFAAAQMRGSEHNDAILDRDGRTATNHAGGINGGISNGNELVFRIAVRPTASIGQPQRTVDLATGERTELRTTGRHDACIALRVPVVLECTTALVLADAMLLAGRLPRVIGKEVPR